MRLGLRRRMVAGAWDQRVRLGPTLRTARFLRPAQVLARASFVAERRLAGVCRGVLARHYARRLAAVLETTTDAGPLWRWPPAPLDPASRARAELVGDLLQGRFTFLNESRTVRDWQAPDASRLWLFHLHGFSYAIDLAVAARRGRREAADCLRSLLTRWLEHFPVDGSDAWHPFVVSERLMAWLVAREILPELDALLRAPILLHALFLERHLERDVGGNHLIKNLVALLLAGCAFDGPAPERWRSRTGAELARQLRVQILSDGGHYERSPMYHLLVLSDLLSSLLAAGRRDLRVAVPLAQAVRAMQSVARGLVHPDGEIPLFNDAVLGEAPAPERLVGPSTAPVDALPVTGYALLRLQAGVLIADCGPPGPDDLPAHVHADALSFELSLGSQRVFVDGGVFDYTPGLLRNRLRGTAAHNTVQIDGVDQSEVWGAFRVGRRARVHLHRLSADLVEASHDGYGRLGVRHTRRVDAVEGVGWRVLDTLVGNGEHLADARLRLHPNLGWSGPDADGCYMVCDGDGRVILRVQAIGGPTLELEPAIYAERFSVLQHTWALRLRRKAQLPVVFGCWLLLPGAAPAVV